MSSAVAFLCEYPCCCSVLDVSWKQFCVPHFKEDRQALESGVDDRTPEMKAWFYEIQGGVCNYCGKCLPIGDLVWEHMKPWRQGGSSAKSNLQLACKPCNKKKLIRTDREFRSDNKDLLPQEPRRHCSPPIDSKKLREVDWRKQFGKRR